MDLGTLFMLRSFVITIIFNKIIYFSFWLLRVKTTTFVQVDYLYINVPIYKVDHKFAYN